MKRAAGEAHATSPSTAVLVVSCAMVSLGRSDAPAEVRLEIHEPGRNDQDTSHQGANN